MSRQFLKRGSCTRTTNTCKAAICLLPFLFFVHLYISYLSYRYTFFSDPPRTTALNHSISLPNSTLYTRHVTPWRKYEPLHHLNLPDLRPWQSQHRYLVASTPDQVGDGIGHRYLAINYELLLARALNLTYVHRMASYGSLTVHNPRAVDDFFGWPHPFHTTRRQFLDAVCAMQSHSSFSECHEHLVYCRRLRESAIVKHIVILPPHVATCLKHNASAKCRPIFEEFVSRNSHPGTLFHTPPVCSWKLFWSSQRHTNAFFFNQYWSASRKSRHDPRYVNIAVHVRRGDFLDLSHRVTIKDAIYARVVRQIIALVAEEEQEDDGPTLRFRVEIYSQGLFRPQTRHPLIAYLAKKGLFGFHNVNDYGDRYVTEKGYEVPKEYWNKLLGSLGNVEVNVHVSENTLDGLEQMISADVLVGSKSALSVHIAATLSRGIPFLPLRPPVGAGTSKAVIWDAVESTGQGPDGTATSHFDTMQFRKIWKEYRAHIGADKTALGVLG